MGTYMPDEMKHYKNLLESIITDSSVGMNPIKALSDKELDQFQQMPADKQKIASPDQQTDLDAEETSRGQDASQTDEGNEFSGARKAAIDAGKDEFTVGGKTYKVSGTEELSEGPADNFTPEDIKHLEQLPDLETMKMFAKKLISTPSRRPMKPQKVMWLSQAIDSKRSPADLVKLMYDLLLGGEGHSVIGSRHSMDPNMYRKTFNEDTEQDGHDTSAASPLSQYKRKNVQGLYSYDHWEHPDGSFVQVRHGKPFMAVHQNAAGDRTNFDSFDDLKSHINQSHGAVPESSTTNQFEDPKGHASHAAPNWGKEGTTSQNYSKGETKKWDSYMSNESTDTDLSEGMDQTDPKHMKMAQAAQEFLRRYGKHIASSQDYGPEDISALKALAHYTATRQQIRHALEVLKSQSPHYDRQAHYGWHGDGDKEVFRKDMHGVTTETLGTTADDYSKAEQDAWDEKGSDWDDIAMEAKAHLSEKWAGDTKLNPKKKGMFAGKTKAELKSEYNKLKASGPHKKGSAENTKMKELAFAIRAKGDWGKIDESASPVVADNAEDTETLNRIRVLSGLK